MENYCDTSYVVEGNITKEEAYKFISEKTGRNITNDEELETLQNELSAQQGACYIYEYE